MRQEHYCSEPGCREFQSTHPARGATPGAIVRPGSLDISIHAPREGCDRILCWCSPGYCRPISIHAPREGCDSNFAITLPPPLPDFNPRTPRGVRPVARTQRPGPNIFQSTHPARGATVGRLLRELVPVISIHAPREGCDQRRPLHPFGDADFNPRTPRGVRPTSLPPRCKRQNHFNPRTPRGVRQQTLPKSREFAWLNSLICTRGRRLSIQKQTRLCSIKLSFMLFGCEPAGEGVSSWTSHATKSKVRLEGRSAYSQSVRSSAHSDFPRNKSGDCPVRGP